MTPQQALALSDAEFLSVQASTPMEEWQALIHAPGGAAVRERFAKLTDYVSRKGNGDDKSAALKRGAALALTRKPSEDSVALAFAMLYQDQLRFSHDRGRWFEWDGARWREESTQIAYEFARQLAREANAKGARAIARSSFAAGVERFARSDRTFAMCGDEWDADPWLLGTPAGTVDLRTGELRPANPSDLITRTTSVAPEEGEPMLWRQFLAQATREDEELELLLRQIAGYALTGDTREECLFFFYGSGGNGKGTFIGALREAMGEYTAVASMDTFIASRYERHSTDLAMLAGARLVIASETREGRVWDEQRVKMFTGQDPITARFMREDNFTYRAEVQAAALR